MRGFRLIGTGMAVPGIRFSNDDFSGWLDTSDAWIRPRTGIKARYFCRQPQEQVHCGKGTEDAEAQSGPVPESAYGPDCTATLAASAGEEALKNAGVSPSDIGLIICATSTPSEAMPSTACLVQKRLGIPSGTAALDLNAACTGFIYAMSVAFSLLQAAERTASKPLLPWGCRTLQQKLLTPSDTCCPRSGLRQNRQETVSLRSSACPAVSYEPERSEHLPLRCSRTGQDP